jgi:ubiquinone/menaquinone biosynthesis C-methylase UbiE
MNKSKTNKGFNGMNNKSRKDKKILDACCGGRMFWFDKEQPDTLFVDNRGPETFTTGLGIHKRTRHIRPDKIMDFRKLDLPDNHFHLVVFDPPHLSKLGDNSFTAKTYGKLGENWQEDLTQGFKECFRVLKPNGILIFKWCEYEIPLSKILKLTPKKPLFGHRSGKQQKTHWLAFMK